MLSAAYGVLVPFYFLLGSLPAIACWLLLSYPVYCMGKNAGVPSPGLSWVPLVGPYYTLGLLAERSWFSRKGFRKGFAKRNLWLPIVILVIALVGIIALFVTVISEVANGIYYDEFSGLSAISIGMIALLWCLVLLVLGIITFVFQMTTLYQVYQDYTPDNAVLFLILSLLFHPLAIIIILLIHKERVPVSVAGRTYPGQPNYQKPGEGMGYYQQPGYGYAAQNPGQGYQQPGQNGAYGQQDDRNTAGYYSQNNPTSEYSTRAGGNPVDPADKTE